MGLATPPTQDQDRPWLPRTDDQARDFLRARAHPTPVRRKAEPRRLKASAALAMAARRSKIARSKEYREFRSKVPRRKKNIKGKRVLRQRALGELGYNVDAHVHAPLRITEHHWVYYQFGDTKKDPIILLPGTSGTAETFFCQVEALGKKGYHVIAAQYPAYWDHKSWVAGFRGFLNALRIAKCHLVGISLGGFMALHFAGRHNERVKSLLLINSFVDTAPFHQSSLSTAMFGYAPEFYLRKYILDSFPKGRLQPACADAVDFVVEQLETLGRSDLGSRLTLNCLPSKVPNISYIRKLPMTLLDTVDDVVLPSQLRDRLHKAFPSAKTAYIKRGGDFPYISAHAEVTMHIEVHMQTQSARSQDTASADRKGRSSSAESGADAATGGRDSRKGRRVASTKRSGVGAAN